MEKRFHSIRVGRERTEHWAVTSSRSLFILFIRTASCDPRVYKSSPSPQYHPPEQRRDVSAIITISNTPNMMYSPAQITRVLALLRSWCALQVRRERELLVFGPISLNACAPLPEDSTAFFFLVNPPSSIHSTNVFSS